MYEDYRVIKLAKNNIQEFIVKKSLNRLKLFMDGYKLGIYCVANFSNQGKEKEEELELAKIKSKEYDEFVTYIENKLGRDFHTVSISLFNHLDDYYKDKKISFDRFLEFYDEFLEQNKEVSEVKIEKYQKAYYMLLGKSSNEQLFRNFYTLLSSMKKRIYMYIGMDSHLEHLKIYFEGIIFSINELSQTGIIFNPNFELFIRDKFDFKGNEDFFKIIKYMYESEEEALFKFFEHLEEFEKKFGELLIVPNKK
ncbi:MAG: hypothetical protein FWE02_01770 [Defluviitaleaceae bacterium]|nr:hypothetical protein [Defluviitaleaceae bacterium]